jgi:hypothetical protein
VWMITPAFEAEVQARGSRRVACKQRPLVEAIDQQGGQDFDGAMKKSVPVWP